MRHPNWRAFFYTIFMGDLILKRIHYALYYCLSSLLFAAHGLFAAQGAWDPSAGIIIKPYQSNTQTTTSAFSLEPTLDMENHHKIMDFLAEWEEFDTAKKDFDRVVTSISVPKASQCDPADIDFRLMDSFDKMMELASKIKLNNDSIADPNKAFEKYYHLFDGNATVCKKGSIDRKEILHSMHGDLKIIRDNIFNNQPKAKPTNITLLDGWSEGLKKKLKEEGITKNLNDMQIIASNITTYTLLFKIALSSNESSEKIKTDIANCVSNIVSRIKKLRKLIEKNGHDGTRISILNNIQLNSQSSLKDLEDAENAINLVLHITRQSLEKQIQSDLSGSQNLEKSKFYVNEQFPEWPVNFFERIAYVDNLKIDEDIKIYLFQLMWWSIMHEAQGHTPLDHRKQNRGYDVQANQSIRAALQSLNGSLPSIKEKMPHFHLHEKQDTMYKDLSEYILNMYKGVNQDQGIAFLKSVTEWQEQGISEKKNKPQQKKASEKNIRNINTVTEEQKENLYHWYFKKELLEQQMITDRAQYAQKNKDILKKDINQQAENIAQKRNANLAHINQRTNEDFDNLGNAKQKNAIDIVFDKIIDEHEKLEKNYQIKIAKIKEQINIFANRIDDSGIRFKINEYIAYLEKKEDECFEGSSANEQLKFINTKIESLLLSPDIASLYIQNLIKKLNNKKELNRQNISRYVHSLHSIAQYFTKNNAQSNKFKQILTNEAHAQLLQMSESQLNSTDKSLLTKTCTILAQYYDEYKDFVEITQECSSLRFTIDSNIISMGFSTNYPTKEEVTSAYEEIKKLIKKAYPRPKKDKEEREKKITTLDTTFNQRNQYFNSQEKFIKNKAEKKAKKQEKSEAREQAERKAQQKTAEEEINRLALIKAERAAKEQAEKNAHKLVLRMLSETENKEAQEIADKKAQEEASKLTQKTEEESKKEPQQRTTVLTDDDSDSAPTNITTGNSTPATITKSQSSEKEKKYTTFYLMHKEKLPEQKEPQKNAGFSISRMLSNAFTLIFDFFAWISWPFVID